MKKFLLALLTAATAAALLCGAAAVSTYSVGYDAPAGISTIVLSEQNRKDVEEISAEYISGLNFIYVKDISQVISAALMDEQVDNPEKFE